MKWKTHWPGAVILLLFLLVGSLYAIYTPRWQVPDEPSHYNYIRSLAEGNGFPVMEAGDYDQAYLERLTSERFPPELTIAPLEYEDHQPPLYYLLATPIFALTGGALLPLRLFSLALGAVAVGGAMGLALEIFPQRPGLAWLAGGLVAFLPQHVAMLAGVNNDALVEALLVLWLLLALRYLRGAVSPLVFGAVLGALLLTKTTGYVTLPLAVLAVILRQRRGGFSFSWVLKQWALILAPALLMGSLWWLRNVTVYGWPDFMGLQRHDAVVVGQPRTGDWIARDGLLPFLRNAGKTAFQSFWGQFGWMGVVLDARIYLGATLFSGLALWGTAWQIGEALSQGPEPRRRDALLLLGTATVITFALPVYYNLTYVQHQARYVFPALPALALAGALGLARLREKRLAVLTSLALVVLAIGLGIAGLLQGDLPLWSLALIGTAAGATLAAGLLPPRYDPLLGGGVVGSLIVLDIWCLFGFIVPLLT
ncbi:MAG: glycosyltransferase family 39 protein [Anaerolineae bacterium]|nr:glycosyltransferase family 39 protein [Anaerolineae bacterium]